MPIHTDDLLVLQRCHPIPTRPVHHQLTRQTSPLKLRDWADALARHPDPHFALYIVAGIRDGFRVGYDYSAHSCRAARRNMQSTPDHPEVVHAYLANECAEGRVLGPFPPSPDLSGQINLFGVIPKRQNKWRLILGPVLP